MRASRTQVQENRRAILQAAGRLFRERGFDSVTVRDVMTSVGLTHGAFYGYFDSKDDLIAHTLATMLENDAPPVDIPTLAEQYLSPASRDNFGEGCPVAALATECIRQPGGARAEMTQGLKLQIDRLSQTVRGADNAYDRRVATGSWAAMVGALILARACDDAELSDEILNETSAWLAARHESQTHQIP